MFFLPALALLAALAETPAEARLRAYVAVINKQDRAAARAFIELNVSKQMTKAVPVDELTDFTYGVGLGYAPLEVKNVVAKGDRATAVLVSPKGVEMPIVVVVESESTHLIAGIEIGAPTSTAKLIDFTGWRTLTDLAQTARKGADLPSLALAAARSEGKIEVAVVGERDERTHAPVRSTDVYWVGSLAKSMTATAIARLIEQGKLKWNTTLGEALDGTEMRAEYRTVTLEQLMQHRSGLSQDLRFDQARVDGIVGGEKNPRRIRERFVADVLLRAPIAKAGEKTVYSNAGYAVLSHVLEVTIAKPFEACMVELLFRPLGMQTAVALTASAPGMPDSVDGIFGHLRRGDGNVLQTFGVADLGTMLAGAGGNVAMSVEDLAIYGRLHLRGLQGKDGLLKAATIRRLHTPLYPGADYASGWVTKPYVHHNGDNGTSHADLVLWPESDLVFAGLTNVGLEARMSPAMQAAIAYSLRPLGSFETNGHTSSR